MRLSRLFLYRRFKREPPYHVTQIANWFIARREKDGLPTYIRTLLVFLYFVYSANLYRMRRTPKSKKMFKCKFECGTDLPVSNLILKEFYIENESRVFYKHYNYRKTRNSELIDVKTQETLEFCYQYFSTKKFSTMIKMFAGFHSPNQIYKKQGKIFERIKDFDIMIGYKNLLTPKKPLNTKNNNDNVVKVNFKGLNE